MTDTEFAVVDVETTGLFPRRHDRVIEIAVVRVNASGDTLDEYATLVNPRRDVGATHIHGLTAGHLINAPSFKEIAGDILSRLAGAVFVAHNVHFDMRFIRSEMDRIGTTLPHFPFLCTMRLARLADPCVPSRRLSQLCDYFGIPATDTHSARGDARATAHLLAICLDIVAQSRGSSYSDVGIVGSPLTRPDWPTLPPSRISYERETASGEIPFKSTYVAQLVTKLPATGENSPRIQEYLALLDRALEDRRVTRDEAAELFWVASEMGMCREDAVAAHRTYMRDLIRIALEDSVISESERSDLDAVRMLLGLSNAEYEKIRWETENGQTSPGLKAPPSVLGRPDVQGKTVCFTGELASRIRGRTVTRSLAERIATENGMYPKKGVTKTLDYLVVADPDSMSGKAKRAREYGIRVIAEPVFWRMLGVNVE